MDVIIPSFINAHLFWVIQKKDILLRSAMDKVMRAKCCQMIKKPEQLGEGQMVCVNINDLWARAFITDVVLQPNEVEKFICWLPDFGLKRSVCYVFQLPQELESCPHIAKQASLHNVVNLTTDLVLGENGYELKLKKTIRNIQGVRQVALEYIEKAEKITFYKISEDECNLYGDIFCYYPENTIKSLTESLISENILAVDEQMFQTLDRVRLTLKDQYFAHSPNWRLVLDRTEKTGLPGIIFNENKKIGTEFFNRKPSVVSNGWNHAR